MKKLTCSSGLGAVLLAAAVPADGATCSCATVPLLGTMELATPAGGNWLLASTYEYHDISDLVSGSSSVPDETGRDRTSQALVLEASRGLSEKWSVSLLGSFVDHDRRVGDSSDSTSGLGDAIAMIKYSPSRMGLYSKSELSFGLGARLPRAVLIRAPGSGHARGAPGVRSRRDGARHGSRRSRALGRRSGHVPAG